MAVTEYGLLHAAAGELTQPFRQRLEEALPVQEGWLSKHYSDRPRTRAERKSAFFQQIEDPSGVLLTERWDSVAAHYEWIHSEENKKIMAGLADLIVQDRATLFHVDAEIFAEPAPEGAIELIDSPVISISRMFVASENKEAFAAKFSAVSYILEHFAKPHLVRGAWRVDKEDEAQEEFVVFCGWVSPERHLEFLNDPGFPKYRETFQFMSGSDVKHFKRFM